jgi:cobyrinic acid a,c-diamide synthase
VGRAGLVVRPGERLCGHEFHRWQLDPVAAHGELWQLEGWGSPIRPEGWTHPGLHASWLHLHWAGCSQVPQRFAQAARTYHRDHCLA